MSNTSDWKKLLDETSQTQKSSAGTTETKVDMSNTTVDPSKITQSYYTTPLTYENYESQSRPVYTQSQAVQDAATKLSEQEASKPGEYESEYGDQIQSLIDSILNRESFSYDYSTDPMYQQYAQQYQQGGKTAMKDAMAEGAALTGGYGNSYAQQVGQQTYQQYMEKLNDIIPELRDAAYNMYVDEGETMRNNLSMLQTEDERDYDKYRDTVSDWQTELNYYYTMYSDMSEAEYQRYMNDSEAWEADRSYWYQKAAGEQEQANGQAEYDYQKAYDEQQQANWEKEFDAKYGSSSSGSRGGSGGGDRDDSGEDEEEEEPLYLPSGSAIGTNQSNLDFIKSIKKLQNSKSTK